MYDLVPVRILRFGSMYRLTLLKNQILRVSLEKKKDARAGSRVKATFFRIIIIASNYDAGKSGFHAESRACVLFSPPGYSQNPIFKWPARATLQLHAYRSCTSA